MTTNCRARMCFPCSPFSYLQRTHGHVHQTHLLGVVRMFICYYRTCEIRASDHCARKSIRIFSLPYLPNPTLSSQGLPLLQASRSQDFLGVYILCHSAVWLSDDRHMIPCLPQGTVSILHDVIWINIFLLGYKPIYQPVRWRHQI